MECTVVYITIVVYSSSVAYTAYYKSMTHIVVYITIVIYSSSVHYHCSP